MSRYVVLMIEVPHNKADLVSDAAVKAGSFGGTVLMGRKISANNIALAFGLGNSSVDIVCMLTESDQKQKICGAIEETVKNEKTGFGIMYDFDSDIMVKTGNITKGEKTMGEQKTNELITVILNRGYADDAMAAARKAGAGGGTVINARGTAREDDAKFFGMHIVPEKEMLMIVVNSDKKAAVLEAIRTLPCLSEPGSGIAFTAGLNDFTLLGKKDQQ